MLNAGDPAPWFSSPSSVNDNFVFDTAAGRYIVLTFFGSAANPGSRRVLDDIEASHQRFDVLNACFFGVSADPNDRQQSRIAAKWPGVIYFWDFDLSLARLYQVSTPGSNNYAAQTLILDPAMRILAIIPFDEQMETHVARVLEILNQWPPVTSMTNFAPVIEVPFVFEPDLCRTLMALYDQHGGSSIGVLRDVGGQTVRIDDGREKRRTDYIVDQEPLKNAIADRLQRRVFTEMRKAFQFNPTQIERYIVSCYNAEGGGFFRAHRDNTTAGSAHRRFACTINLNTEEYDGGELRFPEFGFRTYKPPTGSAIVFSCSLLHEVRPVTRGRRFAFLPFIYDDAAIAVREQNLHRVAADLRQV
jgi:predicted 2-oxoglutarate/Fe(II)-dependent dioxygenase YbiX/peroxiredoxin